MAKHTIDELQWLADYFEHYRDSLFATDVRSQLVILKERMEETHDAGPDGAEFQRGHLA